jgi:hyaluronoglucosaminidase
MDPAVRFARRGIVEGFFGPSWSMAHRQAMFGFGAHRGMNTYLYAPKDDPYHRARWAEPYPAKQWRALRQLIKAAQREKIDFVYGFHPGRRLCFSAEKPIGLLLRKAQRFYDAGVRTFAVLFDDIPSHLEHEVDRKRFAKSLARAQGTWMAEIQAAQPSLWTDVEWWLCPSYYTPDPLLARTFGAFEERFLEILAESLPLNVACFWTGPAVVPEKITLGHVGQIAKRVRRKLILWDNYPVNDLSMSDELHIAPLQGRDSRLPEIAYGYLNNPLLQEELSFIALATCFDYAASPQTYDPESSWSEIIKLRYGSLALPHWQTMRKFCADSVQSKKGKRALRIDPHQRAQLAAAVDYVSRHRKEKWGREIRPWLVSMKAELNKVQSSRFKV